MNYFSQGIKDIIKQALREDIGKRDITTTAIIPKHKYAKAILLAKENCVICGLGIAREVFKIHDKKIKFNSQVPDGQKIKKGKIIAYISGRAQSILTAERVALNFLSLLSGVATKTRAYSDKVKPYKVKILDTRKTIPALRELEKYAVIIGGGYNHRMRLDEMALIKDNHIHVTRHTSHVTRLKNIIEEARRMIPVGMKLEIEVRNLREFKEALEARPDVIMLDNMKVGDIKKAVLLRKAAVSKIEVSGNVNLNNVRKIAKTGVDMISVGALTHSVKATDISLEIL